MSGQTFGGPFTPYYLATAGVDSVSFVKQAAPPLAILNQGSLYELTDGVLYYNGSPVQTGVTPELDAITFTRVGSNPGGVNTEWMDLNGQLHHGSRDVEKNDSKVLYVNPLGGSIASGANGWINSPLSTITEALSLTPTNVLIEGDYSGEAVSLIPTSLGGYSQWNVGSTKLGAVTVDPISWSAGASGLISNCQLDGLVTFNVSGNETISQLTISNSHLSAGLTAVDTVTTARDLCSVVVDNCLISSTVSVTDMNCNITGTFGLTTGSLFGELALIHTDIAVDMAVFADAVIVDGDLVIDAGSTTNTLFVFLQNAPFVHVHVNSVARSGGLVLFIANLQSNITWAAGTQANTTVYWLNRAERIGYSPAVPGYWSIPPTEVASALDELASRPLPTAATGIAGLTTLDYDTPQSAAIDVTPTLVQLTPLYTKLTSDWTSPVVGRLTYSGSDTPKAIISLDMSFLITVGTGDRLIVYLQKNGNPIAACELNVNANVRSSAAMTTVDVGIVNGDYFTYAVANLTEACTLYVYTSDLSIMSV